ncbi:MAG: hypothetical protein RID53_16485, partial [Coleofasciculus sp. B1-GNL1-01]|uniref:hypothetical protein n=1 Tax=Coleofasciculus sp. B1-GNL1-01 TaxID=3068484 RepID=UPI0032FF3754
SHFPTQQVQGFYTITVLHPGIFADLSAEFSLDRGLKPLQEKSGNIRKFLSIVKYGTIRNIDKNPSIQNSQRDARTITLY